MAIKLDVCGGTYPMGGDYLNVDLRALPSVDVVADISKSLPFVDGSVGEIVSCGTLEHFSADELRIIVNEFYRVLAYDAKLVIGVPDLQAIMNAYLLSELESEQLNQYLYGGQKNPFDYHKIGFDFVTLSNFLKDAGFVECQKVPYRFPFHIAKYMMQVECIKREKQPLNRTIADSDPGRLTFTGERMVPDDPELNDLYMKHQARYRFASQYVKGLSVLDAGSGCGYGTHTLALAQARQVTGIDISEAAVNYSTLKYGINNVEFIAADCLAMPFADQTFDCLVSFEVLEHLQAYERYLDECNRVLVENGLFFVSTPNKKIWAQKENPFHCKEFYYDEFRQLLQSKFEIVDILGQNIAPSHNTRNENLSRVWAFQSALINYYEDSFAYTERQLLSIGETTEDLIHTVKQQAGNKLVYLHRSQMDAFRELKNAINRLNAGVVDWTSYLNEQQKTLKSQIDAQEDRLNTLSEGYRKLASSLFYSFWETIIPARLKRMTPRFLGNWLKRRCEIKLNAVVSGTMGNNLNPVDPTIITDDSRNNPHAPPDFLPREIPLPSPPEDGISSFRGLGKINFPVNKNRNKLSKPPVQPEPYGTADIVIRKEFVEDAHYFIAICRKV